MGKRVLHFRLAFAALAMLVLVLGVLLDHLWLLGPGAAAAAFSDLIGLLQARARFPEPATRLMRGGCEILPSIGIAAVAPNALWLGVVVVVAVLMAAGFETISTSRGRTLAESHGETVRRVLTGLGGLVLALVPLGVAVQLPVVLPGADTLVLVGTGLAIVGGTWMVLDIALRVKRLKMEVPTAQDVDT
jgi:hypothetical protein